MSVNLSVCRFIHLSAVQSEFLIVMYVSLLVR